MFGKQYWIFVNFAQQKLHNDETRNAQFVAVNSHAQQLAYSLSVDGWLIIIGQIFSKIYVYHTKHLK